MDCIKCKGHGRCADLVLGVQETWMCERCNGSGEEPFKPQIVYSCVAEMVDPEGFKLRMKPKYFEEA